MAKQSDVWRAMIGSAFPVNPPQQQCQQSCPVFSSASENLYCFPTQKKVNPELQMNSSSNPARVGCNRTLCRKNSKLVAKPLERHDKLFC